MNELAAAAAVTAMSIDDFADEDLEHSTHRMWHEAAAVDVPQRPAAEAAAAQDENLGGNTAPGEPEIAHPKVVNAPQMPLRTRCRPPITRPDGHACVSC